MAMPSSMRILPSTDAAGKVVALSATPSSRVFIAFLKGDGFRYLVLEPPRELQEEGQTTWCKAGRAGATDIASRFGLHTHAFNSVQLEEQQATVSFVGADEQTWLCMSILPPPRVADSQAKRDPEAELLHQVQLPAPVIAACCLSQDERACVALSNGSVRFLSLRTGKAAGKGVKVEMPEDGAVQALCPLGGGRVAIVRSKAPGGSTGEFIVVHFNEQSSSSQIVMHGSIDPARRGLGPLIGARPVADAANEVMLCFGAASDGEKASSGQLSFARATLTKQEPMLKFLEGRGLRRSQSAQDLNGEWGSVGFHIVEWGSSDGVTKVAVRDLRHGILSAVETLPVALTGKKVSAQVALTPGSAVFVSDRGVMISVLWELEAFSTDKVVGAGRRAQIAAEVPEELRPLQTALSKKRHLRDEDLAAFSKPAKKGKGFDQALAAEIRASRWMPTHELVDVIIKGGYWEAAASMYAVKEAEDSLAVRLLAAKPELLIHMVRRGGQHLSYALRDYLPASVLPEILDELTMWLQEYKLRSEEEIMEVIPAFPTQVELLQFIGQLVDGCFPSLLLQKKDALESLSEALAYVVRDIARTESLYGLLRATSRFKEAPRPAKSHLLLEIMALPL